MEQRTSKKNTKAAGFINLTLTDKAGNKHTFKSGIPLHNDRKIDAAVLGDPDLLGRLELSQIEFHVHVVKEDVNPEF